jgi:hypothetical protein
MSYGIEYKLLGTLNIVDSSLSNECDAFSRHVWERRAVTINGLLLARPAGAGLPVSALFGHRAMSDF